MTSIFDRILSGIKSLVPKPDMTEAEVKEVLAATAAKREEKLDWEHSIVDLLKLLKLDSSRQAREELADEMGYDGKAKPGSAEKNEWLHKAVMEEVAHYCVKVP